MSSFQPTTNTCESIVVTCMDFRFQRLFEWWAQREIGERNYDRVAWAGGVKDWKPVLRQIELARRLHQIKKVYLINHEDCGAYGSAGTLERHRHDLLKAKTTLFLRFPDLNVRLFYATLPPEGEEHLDHYMQELTE